MDTRIIRKTAAADEPAVIDTIVLAFSSDPVWRWCWPDPHEYLASAPRFIRAFAGGAFIHDGAYCSDNYAGACLWLRPNVHSDEVALEDILQHTLSETVRTDLNGVLEQMAKYRPSGLHWYLPIIGVDPLHQGKGYGGALLKCALEDCDREHLAAYLESTNARNVSLYQRHGFEVIGTIQSGTSPTIVPMLRSAR
jgi:GNAT superfamily N-acetyltransferase